MAGHHRTQVAVTQTYYRWPGGQLFGWLFIQFCSAVIILGIFADFISVQQKLGQVAPWYFPYIVAISALSVIFITCCFLMFQSRILHAWFVVICSFVMFVLWMVALVKSSLELWGPGQIAANCAAVLGVPWGGPTGDTLGKIQQRTICDCWKAAWSFILVTTILYFYEICAGWTIKKESEGSTRVYADARH